MRAEISDFGCLKVKIQRAKGPLLSVKTTPSPLPFMATKSRYLRPLKVPKRTTYGSAVPGARTPRRVSEPQSSSKNSIFSTELAGIRGLACRAPIFSQKESSRTSSSPTFTTLAISCHASGREQEPEYRLRSQQQSEFQRFVRPE